MNNAQAREEKNAGVRIGNKDVFNEVTLLGCCSYDPLPSPPLLPVGINADALDIAGMSYCDNNLLRLDGVLCKQLLTCLDYLGPSRIAILLRNFGKLGNYYARDP